MPRGAPDDREPTAEPGGPDRNAPDSSTSATHRALINPTFARLFRAMLVSSVGDWAGIIAVTALVARLGGVSGAAYAVAGVMVVRLLPLVGFGPFAGVLVDRVDRRTLMVVADGGRALLYATIPFFGLPGIFVASFFIEALALLWGPSLDASLPNVVGHDELPKANSVILLTSYATLPVGALLFTVLAALTVTGRAGGDGTGFLDAHPESLALWVDAASFAVSAAIVARLSLGRPTPAAEAPATHTVRRDILDEWRLLTHQPRVGALIGSMVAAFAAAGALTALGPLFVLYTMGAGQAGYGVVVTALGVGMAMGMGVLMRRSARVALDRALTAALVAVAACFFLLTVTGSVWAAALVTLALGAAGGTAWVSGYTLLQEEVADEYRGRTFALLTVSARVALLTSRVLFPLLAGAIGTATLTVAARTFTPGGTRVAFVLAALLLLAGAWLSRRGRLAP